MASIKSLCSRCVVLENGSSVFDGDTNEAIEFYLKNGIKVSNAIYENLDIKVNSDIVGIKVLDSNQQLTSVFQFDAPIFIAINGIISPEYMQNAALSLRVKDNNGVVIFADERYFSDSEILNQGFFEAVVKIPGAVLLPNTYQITIGFHIPNRVIIRSLFDIVSFIVAETGTKFEKYKGIDFGFVNLNCHWKIQ